MTDPEQISPADLGQFLRSAREALGLTQAECATVMGRHQRTIDKWESGEDVSQAACVLSYLERLGWRLRRVHHDTAAHAIRTYASALGGLKAVDPGMRGT